MNIEEQLRVRQRLDSLLKRITAEKAKKPTVAQFKAWQEELQRYEAALQDWDARLDAREGLLNTWEARLLATQTSQEDEGFFAPDDDDDDDDDCVVEGYRAAQERQKAERERIAMFGEDKKAEREIDELEQLFALPDRRKKK